MWFIKQKIIGNWLARQKASMLEDQIVQSLIEMLLSWMCYLKYANLTVLLIRTLISSDVSTTWKENTNQVPENDKKQYFT